MTAKHIGDVSIERACKLTLNLMGDNQLIVGPWSWQPSDGSASKLWYFMISMCNKNGEWKSDMITAWGEEARADFINGIMSVASSRGKALIIHTFEDELEALKWCEMLWPGDRVTKIRKATEAERASWAAEKEPK